MYSKKLINLPLPQRLTICWASLHGTVVTDRWKVIGKLIKPARSRSLPTVMTCTASTMLSRWSSDGSTLISDHQGIITRWAEHFCELLSHVNPADPEMITLLPFLPPVIEMDSTPTFDEVHWAIKNLKNNKAEGLSSAREVQWSISWLLCHLHWPNRDIRHSIGLCFGQFWLSVVVLQKLIIIL